MEYWITHCGNDGYLYLLFQRRFLNLTLYLSAVSIGMSLAMNLLFLDKNEQSGEQEDFKTFISQWFDRTTLANKELSNYRGWFHVTMVFIHTFLTINFI